jgi:uncharacterized membrane protein YphA (DoxX/SURF4 family)
MKQRQQDVALVTLRLVLGLVVVIQSFLFLYGGESAKFFARHGLPDAIRQVLGWSEVVAAVLFLVPPTIVVGAWSLLVVFAAAILVHVAHGQFEVGGLLVYSAAVFVVLAFRERQSVKIDARVAQR